MKISKKSIIATSLTAMLLLAGCNDDSSTTMMVEETPTPPPPMPVTYSYQLVVSNLTYAQPMSPVAVVLHDEGALWAIGESASLELETLAESGDNTSLLAQDIVLAGQSGAGLIMPGMSETIDISIVDNEPSYLSLATMLVNTNDAFTGINAMQLSNLAVGESISVTTSSYDSGTEKNTEALATIPGPASGGQGEGFNEMRDDSDKVAMHSGVVTVDDGLSTSALTQAHRFDNPTLKITISRTN